MIKLNVSDPELVALFVLMSAGSRICCNASKAHWGIERSAISYKRVTDQSMIETSEWSHPAFYITYHTFDK